MLLLVYFDLIRYIDSTDFFFLRNCKIKKKNIRFYKVSQENFLIITKIFRKLNPPFSATIA